MKNFTAKRKIMNTALGMALLAALALSAFAQAPDATGTGPLAVTSAEYKFDPIVDPDISALPTELWARVYRPTDLSGGPFPLVIFLHGNHATCGRILPSPPFPPGVRADDNTQYTFYGTCPPTSPIVTPNHLGYAYLAERLASWGYIVVSINANRGINAAPGFFGDAGLNLTRGRLALKHLQRLSEWNTNGGTPASLGVDLQGKLDFSQVGLLGHSRGGEGMRAAYNQYRDMGSPWPGRIPDPINFQGIFEIGPVDGQTGRILNADGTAWNVLLPMCDGDVFNLQGVKPFDRMMRIFSDNPATQKSTFTVWGANHNFYNTEWQLSDSDGCFGPGNPRLFPDFVGSPNQRQTALASALAFFRGNVGPNADSSFNQNFDPQFTLPPVVTSVTRVDRAFIDSPNSGFSTVFEDFDRVTGTNSSGAANDASNITITHRTGVPNHDATQRAAFLSWTAGGPATFFQSNWTAAGSGRDMGNFSTLDFRISRQCAVPDDSFCRNPSPLNPAGPTDFSIQLALADGTLSDAIKLSSYADLRGPIGAFFVGFGSVLHPILQTVRVPLGDFGVDTNRVRGVRFTFDGTPQGAIYLANIRLSSPGGLAAAGIAAASADGSAALAAAAGPAQVRTIITEGNTLRLRTVVSAAALGNVPAIEVEVTSTREFPVRDELAVLRIGAQEFNISRYPDTGDTHTLIFTLVADEFAQAASGADITVQYGSGESNLVWSFGPLNKALLTQ